MVDERYILPYRESAADVVIEQHIAAGGLTGPCFPQISFLVENVAEQAPQTRQWQAIVSDTIIWAIAGMSFIVTEGPYAGRQIELDSSQIMDLSLTNVPGAVYLQPDFSLFLRDQDSRAITEEEGIPSFIFNRITGPIYLRDPFIIPNSKMLKATIQFHRNAGVVGKIALHFFGTLLYAGRGTAR